MGTNVDKGLPLFEAVRTYSDPAAWVELEKLLSVEVDPAEKAKWSPHDWARHDYRMKTLLGLAYPGFGGRHSSKFLPAWHHWLRLTPAIRRRLQSGELVATGYVELAAPGYVEPVKSGDPPIVILPDMWATLMLDFGDSTASSGAMKVIRVRVARAVAADVSQPRPSPAPPVRQRRRGGPRPGNYIGPLNIYLDFLFEKRGGFKFFEETPLIRICAMVRAKFTRSEMLKFTLPKSRSQLEKRIKEFVARKRRETPS